MRAYSLDLRKKIIEAVEPSATSSGGIRCAALHITLRFEQTRPEADAKGGYSQPVIAWLLPHPGSLCLSANRSWWREECKSIIMITAQKA
jgi:hypothetical protein